MNKEAGKMRSIRRNKEGIGFVILTTLLSLTFIVSIVYAGASSGIKNDVQWSIYAGDLSYNSATDTSSSDHWIYVTNNSNIPVYLWYELKHSIDNTWEIKEFPPGNKLMEISPDTTYPLSKTITRNDGDVPAGQHTLHARVKREV